MATSIDSSFDVYAMIGNPVIQTKTPQIFNQYCTENGISAVMVPMLIRDNRELRSFLDFIRGTDALKGFVTTIPHKSNLLEQVDSHSETAFHLKTVNTVRKSAEGKLHGTMFDGTGFMHALRKKSILVEKNRAIVIGSGAAGRAIALELLMAGVSDLVMVDPDPHGHQIFQTMGCSIGAKVQYFATCPDLSGFHVVINASPLGMLPDDPLPVAIDSLSPAALVADTVTNGKPTRFLSLAEERGCVIQTGEEMAAGHLECVLEFFGIQAMVFSD